MIGGSAAGVYRSISSGSSRRRRNGSIAGGTGSSSIASSASATDSSRSASPITASRGISSPAPPARTNAACTALRARLLGNRTSPWASPNASSAKRSISPAASASAKARWTGTEKTRGLASAIRQGGFGRCDARRRADVEPLPHVRQAIKPARGDRPVPQYIRRKGASRRIGEQARRDELNAGVDKGRDPPGLAPRQAACGVHMEIAAPAVARRARLPDQQQQRVHAGAVPVPREMPDAVFRPIGPDIVAVDDQYGVAAKLRQRLDHAAAGFEQQVALVRNRDAETALLRREMRLQCV